MTQSPRTRTLITWLRWPAALGLVAAMFWQQRSGFEQISQHALLWNWAVMAVLLRGVNIGLGNVRWWLLVRSQDIPLRLVDATRMGLWGNLFSLVVPGTVGGDLAKAVMIVRERPDQKAIVTGTVIVDRVLGLVSLTLLGFVMACCHPSLWAQPELAPALMILAGGTLAGTAVIGTLLHPAASKSTWLGKICQLPKVGELVRQVMQALRLYQSQRSMVLSAVVLSVIGHIANVGAFYASCEALHLTQVAPSFALFLVTVPVAEVAANVLPLPGGIGAREGALQVLFAALSGHGASGGEAGFFIAVGFSLACVVFAALGGAIALLLAPRAISPAPATA